MVFQGWQMHEQKHCRIQCDQCQQACAGVCRSRSRGALCLVPGSPGCWMGPRWLWVDITAESGGTSGLARVCLPVLPLAVSTVGIWPPRTCPFGFWLFSAGCVPSPPPPGDLHGSRAPAALIIPSWLNSLGCAQFV